jgi:hypothetical protein
VVFSSFVSRLSFSPAPSGRRPLLEHRCCLAVRPLIWRSWTGVRLVAQVGTGGGWRGRRTGGRVESGRAKSGTAEELRPHSPLGTMLISTHSLNDRRMVE